MTDEALRYLLDQVDDYEQTISTNLAFCHKIRWNDKAGTLKEGSYFFMGRRMDTSKTNLISPSNTVTPDIILQLSSKYGFVGEVKIIRSTKKWDDIIDQIKKYDDDLKGWRTKDEYIDTIDLILLINYKMKTRFIRYLEEKIAQGLSFHHNFAVVSFVRNDDNEIYISFEKGFGQFHDRVLDEVFTNITTVPLRYINPVYQVRFCDNEPPIPYTMQILWELIFSQYPSDDNLMDSGKKYKIIKVEINDLVKKMRDQFFLNDINDLRQPTIPKKEWVKKALDKLIEMKYVSIDVANNGVYIVKWRVIKNPLAHFSLYIAKTLGQTQIEKF